MKFLIVGLWMVLGSFAFAESDLELQSLKAVPEEGSAEMEITLHVINGARTWLRMRDAMFTFTLTKSFFRHRHFS